MGARSRTFESCHPDFLKRRCPSVKTEGHSFCTFRTGLTRASRVKRLMSQDEELVKIVVSSTEGYSRHMPNSPNFSAYKTTRAANTIETQYYFDAWQNGRLVARTPSFVMWTNKNPSKKRKRTKPVPMRTQQLSGTPVPDSCLFPIPRTANTTKRTNSG